MKQVIVFLVLVILFAPFARTQEPGIQFEQTLSWPEILKKAKAENKYIFLDCYASWCGPCKFMDAKVYPAKEAGDYYNAHYISVRLQMDKTAGDDQRTKDWYGVAHYMERTFAVNSYPTFLFFDPAGMAVHKRVGSKDVAGLIAMGEDAQNPAKQYYTVVKNFEPGKIDTGELKALARQFRLSDKDLAGKMAFDFLSRVPAASLNSSDNRKLMLDFQDDSVVLRFTIDYIQRTPKDAILDFIAALGKHPAVKAVALDYIRGLDKQQLGSASTEQLMEYFSKNVEVRSIARKYLRHLSAKHIYSNMAMIGFAETFTDTVTDYTFKVFYKNRAKADQVAGRDAAEGFVAGVITKAEWVPIENIAHQTMETPNFDSISMVVANKYGKDYAERVVIGARMGWYSWLARTKKIDQYWPDYITARMAQVERYRMDTLTGFFQQIFVNNFSYNEVFRYCNNRVELDTVAAWMKELTDRNPKGYNEMDTYACILYKAGHANEAVQVEERALALANDNKSKGDIEHCQVTIEKMKKGERIWEEKEYIAN
jgi:thioredoxin-related protein